MHWFLKNVSSSLLSSCMFKKELLIIMQVIIYDLHVEDLSNNMSAFHKFWKAELVLEKYYLQDCPNVSRVCKR